MKRKLSLLLISLLTLSGCEFMNTNVHSNYSSSKEDLNKTTLTKEDGMNYLKTFLYDNLDNNISPSYTMKTDGVFEDISGVSLFIRQRNDAYIYQSNVSSKYNDELFEGNQESYTYYNETLDRYETKKYLYAYNCDLEEAKRNPLIIENDLNFPDNLNAVTSLLIQSFLFINVIHPKDFEFPSSDLDFSSFEAYKNDNDVYSINFTRDLDVGEDHYFSDVKITINLEEGFINYILDVHINKKTLLSFNSYIEKVEDFPPVGYTIKTI